MEIGEGPVHSPETQKQGFLFDGEMRLAETMRKLVGEFDHPMFAHLWINEGDNLNRLTLIKNAWSTFKSEIKGAGSVPKMQQALDTFTASLGKVEVNNAS